MVAEVMGRYAGWIALHAGVAGGADAILIPEIPYDIEHRRRAHQGPREVGRQLLHRRRRRGRGAEGRQAAPDPGSARRQRRAAGRRRPPRSAAQLGKLTGKETRSVVLGHLQRGALAVYRAATLASASKAGGCRARGGSQTMASVEARHRPTSPPCVRAAVASRSTLAAVHRRRGCSAGMERSVSSLCSPHLGCGTSCNGTGAMFSASTSAPHSASRPGSFVRARTPPPTRSTCAFQRAQARAGEVSVDSGRSSDRFQRSVFLLVSPPIPGTRSGQTASLLHAPACSTIFSVRRTSAQPRSPTPVR